MAPNIILRGVKTHNLKNFDLTLPYNRLIVITGVSGSGKSSLAFDTIYAEGQRRYVESLSSYARQFLSVMEKPDVEKIDGLSPTIAIDQKTVSHNPRSTVGTVTEIYDYLRLLFAKIGESRCPEHQIPLQGKTTTQIIDTLSTFKGQKITILSPVLNGKKGEARKLLDDLLNQGFIKVRIDQNFYLIDEVNLNAQKSHHIEVEIDRLTVKPDNRERIAASVELALKLSNGKIRIISDQQEYFFSTQFACPVCNYSLADMEPRLFSFNNPSGACPHCNGLGHEGLFKPDHILTDENWSISEGAIGGWGSNHQYFFSFMQGLAQHYHFSLDKPYRTLSEKIKRIIWYGSGTEKIASSYYFGNKLIQKSAVFEGVLSLLTKRYFSNNLTERQQEELSALLSYEPCSACQGSRLRKEANAVFINDQNIGALTKLNIVQLQNFLTHLTLDPHKSQIGTPIIKEIHNRLSFLINVGLDYISLNREANTLSGGEGQRIRLASQLGSGLVGITYVLDEPTVGLHPRDTQRLIKTLQNLRDLGNTVIVVEHDAEMIKNADIVVDIGPLAGREGGQLCFCDVPQKLKTATNSLTGKYLFQQLPTLQNQFTSPAKKEWLSIYGASQHNLKNLTVHFPLGHLICVTGVSGSGKSSLVKDLLWPLVARKLNRALIKIPQQVDCIEGLNLLDKAILVTQEPIGRTPHSNPATYTGIFSEIRELFAKTTTAKIRGYQAGRFSFNLSGGRCENCQGDGVIQVKMHFLSDLYVTCETCQGKRYNKETLEVLYKNKSIADVLAMSINEAIHFFQNIPSLTNKLKILQEVGLGYLQLGQSATTLSGGEAQRIKLAKELLKKSTGKTLYLLDEPTTGLHFHDVNQLLKILLRLRDQHNTLIIIEHNLEIIKNADWIIDLGPEGGDQGGELIAAGPLATVKQNERSYLAKFL